MPRAQRTDKTPNAMTADEWSNHIVHRDADLNDGPEYVARALGRAAAILDKSVEGQPEGYHRHWTRVDAELLRREAIKLHPPIEEQFRLEGMKLVPVAA